MTFVEETMQKPEVSILIDFRIYAYMFKPIIEKMVKRGVTITVFCPSKILDFVIRELGILGEIRFCDLDEVRRPRRLRWMFHRSMLLLFTRADFSYQYGKKSRQEMIKSKGLQRVLLKLAWLTPKVPNHKINTFLKAIAGIGLGNPFPTPKIVVGSLNASAELLCGAAQKIYTIMESWDHPVKWPNGYVSTRVYAWNQSLGEDWEATQSDKSWIPTYPLKLRYAIESIFLKKKWEKRHGKRPKPLCAYAVASTRRFSVKLICDLEDRIINDLCKATEKAGWDLFIKPRPNGLFGEFDKFVKEHAHVSVGSIVNDEVDVAANYYLDDTYNMRRFDELLDASMVINAFTTFGLDAAVAGIPVLQLDLRQACGYEDSCLIYNNHHIRKYLLRGPAIFMVKGEVFRECITDFLKNPSNMAEQYSNRLRNWLIPNTPLDDILDEVIDDILR